MDNIQEIEQYKIDNPELAEVISSVQSVYDMTIRQINHEFGNALTLVSSSLQFIQTSHPEVESFKYWHSTMKDVNHMSGLVNSISCYSNCTKMTTDIVDLYELLNDIVSSFSTKMISKNIQIGLTSNADIALISGDFVKLRQAFINLIKNSYEAIDGAGIITISTYNRNNNICIEFTDSGCGIPREYVNSIFIPLVTFKDMGNGLGLPIVKKIIEAHCGTITLKSTGNFGTTFLVTLPTL